MSSCEFCKIFKNLFFTERLKATASMYHYLDHLSFFKDVCTLFSFIFIASFVSFLIKTRFFYKQRIFSNHLFSELSPKCCLSVAC